MVYGQGPWRCTFSLKLLPHFFEVLEGLVGRGLERLASRLGAANRVLKLDVDLKLLGVERVKFLCFGENSLQNGYDNVRSGLACDRCECGLCNAQVGGQVGEVHSHFGSCHFCCFVKWVCSSLSGIRGA